MSYKSVSQECRTRVSYKSVPQECPARVPHKSVPQECPIRVPHKSVLQECPTRVSYKSDPQECPTRVSYKSVPEECPARVSHKSVPQECPTSVLQECHLDICSFSNVFAFGFVGSILFHEAAHVSIQVCHVPDANLSRSLCGKAHCELLSLEDLLDFLPVDLLLSLCSQDFRPEEWGLPPF